MWIICRFFLGFLLFPNSSFAKVSSKHLHSQTIKTRELKFWEKGHLPQPIMCHLSDFFFTKFVNLVGRESFINGAYPDTPSSFTRSSLTSKAWQITIVHAIAGGVSFYKETPPLDQRVRSYIILPVAKSFVINSSWQISQVYGHKKM